MPEAEPPATESPGTENDEPSTPAQDAAGGGEEAKKPCPELDKSTCQVTMGCVWNEVKKCVQETSSDQ
jgi:hypothetical protein